MRHAFSIFIADIFVARPETEVDILTWQILWTNIPLYDQTDKNGKLTRTTALRIQEVHLFYTIYIKFTIGRKV